MIKAIAELDSNGWLYLFGLTEGNLNRMEFNGEPIFFDFGYAGHLKLFGLIHYFPEFNRPEDIKVEQLEGFCQAFVDLERNVTFETLRFFPLARSVMEKFRSTPFWGLNAYIEIAHSGDRQIFFAGQDEKAIEDYFVRAGLITPQTKRTSRGFKNG